jgi:hypothetical protein
VTTFKLTQTKTREYVGELLAQDGAPPQVRLTRPVFGWRLVRTRP